MGVLLALVGAVLTLGAGCYRPSVSDCVVRCTEADACADGQVCGVAGLCVDPNARACSPALPGDGDAATGSHDGSSVTSDASVRAADALVPPDAATPDAQDSPDAGSPDAAPPPMTNLRILINGRGQVVVEDPPYICTSTDDGGWSADCTLEILEGAAVSLVPMQIHQSREFLLWTGLACAGQGSPCTFVAAGANQLVGAEFEN